MHCIVCWNCSGTTVCRIPALKALFRWNWLSWGTWNNSLCDDIASRVRSGWVLAFVLDVLLWFVCYDLFRCRLCSIHRYLEKASLWWPPKNFRAIFLLDARCRMQWNGNSVNRFSDLEYPVYLPIFQGGFPRNLGSSAGWHIWTLATVVWSVRAKHFVKSHYSLHEKGLKFY